MADRPYDEPDRLPGETNWQWALRFAAAIPPDWLARKLIRYLVRMEGRRRTPAWSVIADATGHGSTVSSAIVEHYVPDEVKPNESAPWVKLDMAACSMNCERCGQAESIKPQISFAELNYRLKEYKKNHSKCRRPR